MIDVRDLAAWIVTLAEQRVVGDFDGVGRPTPIGDLLRECAPDAELTWVDQEFLTGQGVEPWMGPDAVPLWLPRPEYDGMMQHLVEPALDAGLVLRPVAETSRDTLEWLRADPDAGVHRHRSRPRARAARCLARSRLTDAGVRPPYAPGVIKYLGSKRTLVPVLGELAVAAGARTALDLFTGTTRVAQELKRRGIDVTASDLATYSAVLSDCYVATDAAAVDERRARGCAGPARCAARSAGLLHRDVLRELALLPAAQRSPRRRDPRRDRDATTRRATRCGRSC